ncbi:cation/H(+) antiporter 2-like [Wolffia australiana]
MGSAGASYNMSNDSMMSGTGNISAYDYMNQGCGLYDSKVDYKEVIGLFSQFFLLIALSHVLHLALKRVGQATPISQILAGVILGPSVLLHIKPVAQFLYSGNLNMDFLASAAGMGRQIFMFLIGLEIDIPYLVRSSRIASVVAVAGILVSAAVALFISPLIYKLLNIKHGLSTFALTLIAIFANTSSPTLVRMSAELKLNTSEVGRLAISSALINDMSGLLFVAACGTIFLSDNATAFQQTMRAIIATVLLVLSIYLSRPLVRWINRRNKHRRTITFFEFVSILLLVLLVSTLTEAVGYSAMMTCFLLGLFFPREGSSARTLINWLTYPIHNFLLPIYFGYAGFQADLSALRGSLFWAVLIMVFCSTASKLLGTLIAARHLKIRFYEGLVLGFLLNVKGHVSIILIGMAWGLNVMKP